MNCDRVKIIEYIHNELDPLETIEIKGHLETCTECQDYFKNMSKMNDILNIWDEKQNFGKDFDYNILSKVDFLLEKQSKYINVFRALWRTAIVFTALLLIIIVYRNTFFDNYIHGIYNIIEYDIKNNVEIEDLKNVYLPNKIIKEITTKEIDTKTLLNLELICSIPDNILLQEQKIDINILLKDIMLNKKSQRFWLLNFFDGAIFTIEKSLWIDFSFADVNTSLSDLFKQSCLNFKNKSYDNALEKLKIVISNAKNPIEVSSALFKLGYIYETLQRYDDAISCYKRIKKEFPDTLQSVLSDGMIELVDERKVVSKRINKIKKDISLSKITPKTYYELGNMYLMLLDYNSALNAYSNAIAKSYGVIVGRARFNSGWCYKIIGNEEESLKMFNSVTSSDGDLRMASYSIMSLIYIKQGDLTKANELFKEDEYPIVYKNLIKKYFKSIGGEKR